MSWSYSEDFNESEGYEDYEDRNLDPDSEDELSNTDKDIEIATEILKKLIDYSLYNGLDMLSLDCDPTNIVGLLI